MGTCWQKLDKYFFPMDRQFIQGTSVLFSLKKFRIIKITLCLLIWAAQAYNQTIIEHPYEEYIYLTEWGVWLTFIYFTISTANMISVWKRNKPLWTGAWKLETILHLTAFVDEFVITIAIVFWSALYQQQHTLVNLIKNLFIHLLPLCLLSIDAIINSVAVDSFRHLYYIIAIDIVYFTINIIWTLTKWPIYQILTYKDLATYLYLLGACFLGVVHFSLYRLFYRRVKESKMEDSLDRFKASLLTIPQYES